MAKLQIRLVNWDKIVDKYGKKAAERAEAKATAAALIFAVTRVKKRLAGKHHVTGFLVNSIVFKADKDGTKGVVFAKRGFGVYYARFVEEGTGIYGPRKQPIRPTRAKMLSWHPTTVTGAVAKGGGRITRRSVKGQRPVHFMKDTAREDKKAIVERFRTTFQRQFIGV